MKDTDTHDASTTILADTVAQTHDVLAERLATAEACHNTRERPRELTAAADPFLASTSRHVAAASAVLAPAARHHLPHGRQRAQDLARTGRDLEAALFETKAKLYGSTFSVRRPLADVWADVDTAFAAFWGVEQQLVADLDEACPSAEREQLADRLYRAEERVPTRPHPHLPHLGVPGRMARTVAQRVDRFWDTAEGRMVPAPIAPTHERDGLMTRYLLADPDMSGIPGAEG